jgi:hypothetical protein
MSQVGQKKDRVVTWDKDADKACSSGINPKGNVVCFAIDFLVKDTSAAVLAGISSKAERLIPLGVGELKVLGEDVFEALE